jgi:hypothetical protein
MHRIAMRLELVIDCRDASHGCHALYELIDLGLEYWPRQSDGTAARDDVNRSRMRDQAAQPRAHPPDEHVVGRHFFLDQPTDRMGRRAAQTMPNVSGRHPGDGVRTVSDV